MRHPFSAASFFMLLTLVIPLLAKAQPPVPGDPGATPIDGGLSLLVAAGIGYGAKKLYDKRRKGQTEGIDEK